MNRRDYEKMDYYGILGIKKSATEKEIKDAFRRKAREFHPDRYLDVSEAVRANLTKQFQDANEAYNVLTKDRVIYDSLYKESPPKEKSQKTSVTQTDRQALFNRFIGHLEIILDDKSKFTTEYISANIKPILDDLLKVKPCAERELAAVLIFAITGNANMLGKLIAKIESEVELGLFSSSPAQGQKVENLMKKINDSYAND